MPPALAAGLSAFAGMTACSFTMDSLTVLFAPLLGIAVSALAFRVFQMPKSTVSLDAAAPEPDLGAAPAKLTERPWFAGFVAWAVCAGVGAGIALSAVLVSPPGDWMRQHPIVWVGFWIGAIFGLPVGLLTWLGAWWLKRRAVQA